MLVLKLNNSVCKKEMSQGKGLLSYTRKWIKSKVSCPKHGQGLKVLAAHNYPNFPQGMFTWNFKKPHLVKRW